LIASRLGRGQLHGQLGLFMHDCDRRGHRRAGIGHWSIGLATLWLPRWGDTCRNRVQRAEVDIAAAVIEFHDDIGRHGAERGIEIHLDEGAGGAIRVSERTDAGNVLPVDGCTRCRGKLDALDAEIAEPGQFAVVADAVVVGILPDHKVTERRILAVDHAIMVAVEARQCGNAIGEVAAIERRREQLVAAFDPAGAVDIQSEDAVTAIGGPGDLVLGAVAVDVG